MKRVILVATALALMALPSFAARRRALTPPGDPCMPGVIASPYVSAELTIDDGYVYFADDIGGLYRAPKGGGLVTTLLSLNDGEVVQMIVVDGDTLFFGTIDLTGTLGTIYSMPRSGGTPTTLVSGILTLNDLIADDTSIYWVSFGTPNIDFTLFLADGGIGKAAKDGTNRVVLVRNLSEPTGIAVDGTSVYYAESGAGLGNTSAGVRSMPKNGGGTVTRLTNGVTTVALAASTTDLYFSTFNSNSGAGTIQKISKSGGATTTMEQTSGVLTEAIRLTADKLYAHFVTTAVEGIRSIPLTGGTATHVVDSVLDTPRFAVDSCSVYYVTINDSVERSAR